MTGNILILETRISFMESSEKIQPGLHIGLIIFSVISVNLVVETIKTSHLNVFSEEITWWQVQTLVLTLVLTLVPWSHGHC